MSTWSCCAGGASSCQLHSRCYADITGCSCRSRRATAKCWTQGVWSRCSSDSTAMLYHRTHRSMFLSLGWSRVTFFTEMAQNVLSNFCPFSFYLHLSDKINAVCYSSQYQHEFTQQTSINTELCNNQQPSSLLYKIAAFTNNCLRRILNISWKDKTTNQKLWIKAEYEQMKLLFDRKVTWLVTHSQAVQWHSNSNTASPNSHWGGLRRVGRTTQEHVVMNIGEGGKVEDNLDSGQRWRRLNIMSCGSDDVPRGTEGKKDEDKEEIFYLKIPVHRLNKSLRCLISKRSREPFHMQVIPHKHMRASNDKHAAYYDALTTNT